VGLAAIYARSTDVIFKCWMREKEERGSLRNMDTTAKMDGTVLDRLVS
jgi:hypothetical protein